jgi:hypothetical protein
VIDLGIVQPGKTIDIPFNTYDPGTAGNPPITVGSFTVSSVKVYKNGGTTARASTSGFTATTDFNGLTGSHLIQIGLADNTTAGFYQVGAFYDVMVDGITVAGTTQRKWVARFRIGFREAVFETTIATVTSQTVLILASGPAEDNALNEKQVLISDSASNVQYSPAAVLSYVGGTLTVTLASAPTFTVAVGDGISFFFLTPLRPATQPNKIYVDTNGRLQLASDGLDQISVADPGAVASWTTLPKVLVALARRLAGMGKVVKDDGAGEIRTYADDGTTVRSTSTFTSASGVDTVNKAT